MSQLDWTDEVEVTCHDTPCADHSIVSFCLIVITRNCMGEICRARIRFEIQSFGVFRIG